MTSASSSTGIIQNPDVNSASSSSSDADQFIPFQIMQMNRMPLMTADAVPSEAEEHFIPTSCISDGDDEDDLMSMVGHHLEVNQQLQFYGLPAVASLPLK